MPQVFFIYNCLCLLLFLLQISSFNSWKILGMPGLPSDDFGPLCLAGLPCRLSSVNLVLLVCLDVALWTHSYSSDGSLNRGVGERSVFLRQPCLGESTSYLWAGPCSFSGWFMEWRGPAGLPYTPLCPPHLIKSQTLLLCHFPVVVASSCLLLLSFSHEHPWGGDGSIS